MGTNHDSLQQRILDLQLHAHLHGGAVRWATDSISYISPNEIHARDSHSQFIDWEIRNSPTPLRSIVDMICYPYTGLPELPAVDFVPVTEPTQPTNAAVITAALEALLIYARDTSPLAWRGNPTLRYRRSVPSLR